MVGVALVGLGEIARAAHLPALLRHDRADVVAVVDPLASRRRAVLAELPDSVIGYERLTEALDLDAVQAVVLATPPWVTPGLAVQAAQCGRFVLAEKPVATSIDAAARYDVLTPGEAAQIQVGLTYRHDPAMAFLHDLISSGELGERLLVRAHIYDERRTADAAHTALIERTLQQGSPVVHEGAHVFDWLAYLLAAEPVVRDTWSITTRNDLPTGNLVGARLDYGHHQALVEFGWLIDALPDTSVSVLGDRGLAVLDGRTFALTITTAAGTRTVDPPGDRIARCFDRQLTRFVDLAIRLRTDPDPDLSAGRRALAVSHAVVQGTRASMADRVGDAR